MMGAYAAPNARFCSLRCNFRARGNVEQLEMSNSHRSGGSISGEGGGTGYASRRNGDGVYIVRLGEYGGGALDPLPTPHSVGIDAPLPAAAVAAPVVEVVVTQPGPLGIVLTWISAGGAVVIHSWCGSSASATAATMATGASSTISMQQNMNGTKNSLLFEEAVLDLARQSPPPAFLPV